MAETRERLTKIAGELRRQRDELRVRAHLLKAEARDEWTALERKWQQLEGKLKVVGQAAGEAAEDVGEALRLVADELKDGYQRIRRAL